MSKRTRAAATAATSVATTSAMVSSPTESSEGEQVGLVVIRAPSGARETLEVSTTQALRDLKDQISCNHALGCIPVAAQRIFYMGRELKTLGRSLTKLGVGRFDVPLSKANTATATGLRLWAIVHVHASPYAATPEAPLAASATRYAAAAAATTATTGADMILMGGRRQRGRPSAVAAAAAAAAVAAGCFEEEPNKNTVVECLDDDDDDDDVVEVVDNPAPKRQRRHRANIASVSSG